MDNGEVFGKDSSGSCAPAAAEESPRAWVRVGNPVSVRLSRVIRRVIQCRFIFSEGNPVSVHLFGQE